MRSAHPFFLCTSISSLGCSLDLVPQLIHIANTVTPLYAVFNKIVIYSFFIPANISRIESLESVLGLALV
jgi:hypothetical protein